jgi:hypothetical protein
VECAACSSCSQGSRSPRSRASPRPSKRAKRALGEGRAEEASKHALVALESQPDSAEALNVLLRARAAGDGDAKALWAHELTAVLGDEHGKAKLDKETSAAMPAKDASVLAIAAARAAAADELAELVAGLRKSAEKNPEQVLTLHVGGPGSGARSRTRRRRSRRNMAGVFAPGFPLSAKCERDVVLALDAQLRRSARFGAHAGRARVRARAARARGAGGLQGPRGSEGAQARRRLEQTRARRSRMRGKSSVGTRRR